MMRFADKLTTTPCDTRKSDVDALKTAGFKDDEILDITQITAYFNYVNRLACGLGVELESHWEEE